MPYLVDEFGGITWTKGQYAGTNNSNSSWGYTNLYRFNNEVQKSSH